MVKWIKITTDIFDDEKIKIIDKLPARDEILVIWFKLLTLAGKSNENGCLFMSNKIPYTSDMLSAIFNREKPSIDFALGILNNYGMITIEDNEVISITNWEKHQNIEGLDKIREQGRIRQSTYREKQKQLAQNNVTVTLRNALEEDIEIDIEKDIKNKTPFETVWNLYDKKVGSKPKLEKKWNRLSKETQEKIIDYIPKYKESQPDKQYRKNFDTFLNNESWNDELINKENNNGKQGYTVTKDGLQKDAESIDRLFNELESGKNRFFD